MRLINHILATGFVSAVTLTVALPRSTACAADPAFQVPADQRQLFLDDMGIAKIGNLKRTMHQPSKKGAVIRPDLDMGETSKQTRTAPVWNPERKIFQFWDLKGNTAPHSNVSGYYESKDGLHWSKPIVGQIEFRGSKQNNYMAIALKDGGRCAPGWVVYDVTDPDPNRRYKGMGFHDWGKVTATSPDGVNWTLQDVPSIPSEDESNFSFDEKAHLFIATVKVGAYGRSHALSTSKDFVNWTKPELIFHADELDQELGRIYIERRRANPALQQARFHTPAKYHVDVYNFAVFRYEGLYIGLPMMFYQTGPNPTYPNQDGYEEIQLACSRDLHNWKRLGNRAAFIPASPLGAGAYDVGQITPPSNAVVRGDELWFYYSGFKYTHESLDYVGEYPNGEFVPDPSRDPDSGAICLAVLRRDGFISLDAGEQEGMVLTDPFKLPGGKLFVNVDAVKGELRVEVLDCKGKVVAQSEPLSGDMLREPVKWAKGHIADFKDQTASLRFTLRNGQFYSYWME